MGNMADHARRELAIIGEEQETIDWYVRVIDAFNEAGHSGGSASVAIPTLERLLRFQNLSPLTSHAADWQHIAEDVAGQPDLWQCKRNSEAFSHDGGKTYYLLSNRAWEGKGERRSATDIYQDSIPA